MRSQWEAAASFLDTSCQNDHCLNLCWNWIFLSTWQKKILKIFFLMAKKKVVRSFWTKGFKSSRILEKLLGKWADWWLTSFNHGSLEGQSNGQHPVDRTLCWSILALIDRSSADILAANLVNKNYLKFTGTPWESTSFVNQLENLVV